ncbi:hypothetical protein BDC45DRAFT_575103 [Circinella umbellata]|nr:hypothetical protein BDC45DRAFT_575103 [Circinella umbellata]
MENYPTTTFITQPENDGTPITLTVPRLEYLKNAAEEMNHSFLMNALPANEVVPSGEKPFCCNCQAGFTTFVNKDSEDKNMITIQYQCQHTGHEPGSNIDTISGTLPWFGVLETILDSEDYNQLPQSVRIDYHHVYYVMKIHLRRQSQYHPSMANSLIKWAIEREWGSYAGLLKGQPLTWMITNSQAQYPILYWL